MNKDTLKEKIFRQKVYFVRKTNFKKAKFNDLENIIEEGILETQEGLPYSFIIIGNEKIQIYDVSNYKNRVRLDFQEIISISFAKNKILTCIIAEYKKNKKMQTRLRHFFNQRTKLLKHFELVKQFEKQNEMFLLRSGQIIHIDKIHCSIDIVNNKTKFYIESDTGKYTGRISFDKYGKEFFLTEEDALKVRKTLIKNKCPFCHEEISLTGVKFCPFCGKEIIDSRDRKYLTLNTIIEHYNLINKHIWVFNREHNELLYEAKDCFSEQFKDENKDKVFKIVSFTELNIILERF